MEQHSPEASTWRGEAGQMNRLNSIWVLFCLSGFFVNSALADVANLQQTVAKKAAIIKNMHDKAGSALVQVAQDPAFAGYFKASHDHSKAEYKERIEHISLRVQSKFHVEEMCLIDPKGAEVSRIVQNQIAYDLSPDEAKNPFFEPSFKQKPKTIYIAPAYISPDAHKWVLAYTTPIEVHGQNAAILHYEHGLDVYQAALNKEPTSSNSYVVAVDKNGLILSDSRKKIYVSEKEGREDATSYFEPFSLVGRSLPEIVTLLGNQSSGIVKLEGKSFSVAYKSIADWTVVAIEPSY
jgi:Cache domain